MENPTSLFFLPIMWAWLDRGGLLEGTVFVF